MPTLEISKKKLRKLLDKETRDGNMEIISRWLDRGDGCAVYTHQALDSKSAGHKKFVSYGSDESQLPGDHPPLRCPDIGGHINWAYRLTHIFRSAP